jgi:flagellar biosynthesis/type III secretory pathway M-ring protein FliF/YscJ
VQYVLVGVVVIVIAWFITAPLRRPRGAPVDDDEGRIEARVAEIELRKESKYREIRDAELDHAAGKLNDADFERVNAELRREAMAILAELDRASKGSGRP